MAVFLVGNGGSSAAGTVQYNKPVSGTSDVRKYHQCAQRRSTAPGIPIA